MKLEFWGPVLATMLLAACSQADSIIGNSEPDRSRETAGDRESLINQYLQMGSIAGVAERCYDSKAIPVLLNTLTRSLDKSDEMRELLEQYDIAYNEGLTKQTLWIGVQGKYSLPFDCESSEDMEMVKGFESNVIAEIGKQ